MSVAEELRGKPREMVEKETSAGQVSTDWADFASASESVKWLERLRTLNYG